MRRLRSVFGAAVEYEPKDYKDYSGGRPDLAIHGLRALYLGDPWAAAAAAAEMRHLVVTADKYYYYPGWHEPGPTLEAFVNKEAWEALPPDLQAMVESATQAINDDMLSEFTARNNAALDTLINEHDVQLRRLPDDVIEVLRLASAEVVAEIADADPLAKRIYDSYMTFLRDVRRYHSISEQAYLNVREEPSSDQAE